LVCNMASYRICTLFSGSKGNCTYIETPQARILIDMGKNCRAVCTALQSIGVDPDALDAVFITHEHRDHIDALSVFCKHHPLPIHVQAASAARILQSAAHTESLLHVYPDAAACCVRVGDLSVQAFRTPHDSRASVGYRMTLHAEQPIHIGYATDIGCVTPEILENLLGCESVVLESNHDPDMLMDGPYPYDLKLRIRGKKGHLSNEECAGVAAQLYAGGTKNILLAHLSEQNNTPRLAFHETFCAIADKEFNLRVADPEHVSWLLP